MGCWNATCNLTNLPICAGDKIVIIPLARASRERYGDKPESRSASCYAVDVFSPFSLPIVGYYNDYGGIEKIEAFEENEKHLMSLSFFDKGGDKVDVDDNFEDFLNNKICGYLARSVQSKNDVLDHYYRPIDFMIMHYDAYRFVVEEIGKRKFYGKKETMRECIMNEVQECAAKLGSLKNNKDFYFSNDNSPGDIMPIFYMMDKVAVCSDLTKFLKSDSGLMRGLAEEALNGNQKMLESFVELKLFTYGLTSLRKGYLCYSGAGSQSRETAFHYALAKFVINFIKEKAKKHNAESDSKISQKGEKEPFFY